MKRTLSLILTTALLLLAGLLGITVSAETHTDISGDGVGHAFDNACDTTCNDCGYVRVVGEHEYDNACDATCNLCGATRTPRSMFTMTMMTIIATFVIFTRCYSMKSITGTILLRLQGSTESIVAHS